MHRLQRRVAQSLESAPQPPRMSITVIQGTFMGLQLSTRTSWSWKLDKFCLVFSNLVGEERDRNNVNIAKCDMETTGTQRWPQSLLAQTWILTCNLQVCATCSAMLHTSQGREDTEAKCQGGGQKQLAATVRLPGRPAQ